MDVRQLRYVLAIADEGSFTAAAARCRVAQPSLSQAVRALERELGVALFARVGRGVVLTAAGDALVAAARPAVRAFEAVAGEVRAVADVVAGHLDLVALPSLATDPVAELIGRFRRHHPGVTVRLAHADGADGVARAVLTGRAELGVTEPAADGAGLVSEPLGRQEIVAVLPPGSKPVPSLTAAELASFDLVAQAPGAATRVHLDAALATAGVTARVAVETDQREALVPLVLAGAGATVVPRPMAVPAAVAGAVVVPLVPPLWRDLAVIRRPGEPSPAARRFLAVAVAVDSGPGPEGRS